MLQQTDTEANMYEIGRKSSPNDNQHEIDLTKSDQSPEYETGRDWQEDAWAQKGLQAALSEKGLVL